MPIPEKEQQQRSLAVLFTLILGFIYITTVWIPYFYGKPTGRSDAPMAASESPQAAPTAASPEIARTPMPSGEPAELVETAKFPSNALIEQEGLVKVKTDLLEAHISLLGGRLKELYLAKYAETSDPDSPRLSLIEHLEGQPFPLGVFSGKESDTWVKYSLEPIEGVFSEADTYIVPGAKDIAFKFSASLPDGRVLSKTFTFRSGSYFVDFSVSVDRPAEDSSPVRLEWTRFISKQQSSLFRTGDESLYSWFDGKKATHLTFSELGKNLDKQRDAGENPREVIGNVVWLASATNFFMSTVVSQNGAIDAWIERGDNFFRSKLMAGLAGAKFRLYLGPKSYAYLTELDKKFGYELKRSINFGRMAIFSVPLLSLLNLFHKLFGNYGLAIVALTILVRLLLYPLASASFKQMKAMQEIGPEVKRIRETIRDQKQQQQELMALYKKRNVNPLGGCLPVLLQMPIFIALFYTLQLAIELRHADFALWINDLSSPEKCMIFGVPIPIMVVLFTLSMLVQQWITPSTMDPTQKKVMLIMPIVFGFMFMNFPAGLTLYWLTSNLISIGQQQAMHKAGDRTALGVTVGVSVLVFILAFFITLF